LAETYGPALLAVIISFVGGRLVYGPVNARYRGGEMHRVPVIEYSIF
jgi:hypothetical protein